MQHQQRVHQQLRKEVRQEDVQQLKRAEVRHHLFAVADRTLGLLSRGMRVSSVARYASVARNACVFCREVCVCIYTYNILKTNTYIYIV